MGDVGLDREPVDACKFDVLPGLVLLQTLLSSEYTGACPGFELQ